MAESVSFVIPVHGDAPDLDRVLRAIARQGADVETEILVVDDGIRPSASEVLATWKKKGEVRILEGGSRGAAHALNTGLGAASHIWIAQVDQDVVLHESWLTTLLSYGEDPGVGAVQGYWATDRSAPVWSRIMGLDLEERYRRLGDGDADHVCTGNTLYRARALHDVGLFDEELGYGYDNDMSYRLRERGYRLLHCHSATSLHLWPGDLLGYLRHQYGQGYGRLDLIAKHPRRASGDRVSDWRMILHAPLMACALLAFLIAALFTDPGVARSVSLSVGLVLIALLAGERFQAGWRSWGQHGDKAAWLFVPAHLMRDLAWVLALMIWATRRLLRRPGNPQHSMYEKRSASLPPRKVDSGVLERDDDSYNRSRKN